MTMSWAELGVAFGIVLAIITLFSAVVLLGMKLLIAGLEKRLEASEKATGRRCDVCSQAIGRRLDACERADEKLRSDLVGLQAELPKEYVNQEQWRAFREESLQATVILDFKLDRVWETMHGHKEYFYASRRDGIHPGPDPADRPQDAALADPAHPPCGAQPEGHR